MCAPGRQQRGPGRCSPSTDVGVPASLKPNYPPGLKEVSKTLSTTQPWPWNNVKKKYLEERRMREHQAACTLCTARAPSPPHTQHKAQGGEHPLGPLPLRRGWAEIISCNRCSPSVLLLLRVWKGARSLLIELSLGRRVSRRGARERRKKIKNKNKNEIDHSFPEMFSFRGMKLCRAVVLSSSIW